LCLEVIEDSKSVVPVVKLPAEYVDMQPSYVNTATAETADTRETAPEAHVIGNYERLKG